MQQKAQIIATILHKPELIIIDEPFTSLDPVNTRMVKDMILNLSREGTTILMSTHQMHQVEELCDRILLINEGKNVLYGNLEKIRREYSGHAVMVRVEGDLPALTGVENVSRHNSDLKLTLEERVTPQEVLKDLVAHNVVLERFEIAIPTLDEIFIREVGKEEE
jgi:ABC-2 type transport system ATP-binding protein